MLRIAEHVRQDTVTNRPDTRTSMSFCPQSRQRRMRSVLTFVGPWTRWLAAA